MMFYIQEQLFYIIFRNNCSRYDVLYSGTIVYIISGTIVADMMFYIQEQL